MLSGVSKILYYIGTTSKRSANIQWYTTVAGYNVYSHNSNINRTLVANKLFYHSDVDGASPVGAAPTTSSFST